MGNEPPNKAVSRNRPIAVFKLNGSARLGSLGGGQGMSWDYEHWAW